MSKRINAFNATGCSNVKRKTVGYVPWQQNNFVPEEIQTGTVRSALVYANAIRENNQREQKKLPKIVMKHQLYSIMASRTEVDQGISKLQESGDIKTFKTSLGTDQFCLMLTGDYIQYVQEQYSDTSSSDNLKTHSLPKCLTKYLSEVIPNVFGVSVNKECLFEKHNFKDTDITELVKLGVITVKDAGSWWLAIPNVGGFLKMLRKGRQAVLQMIRRNKYNELNCAELLLRKPPNSVKFGLKYHIHDLVGADLVTCRQSTTGVLLRIAD